MKKTFLTIVITMMVTIATMLFVGFKTGIISLNKVEQDHSITVLVDGEVCNDIHYSNTLGVDVNVSGHTYIGR